MNSWDSSQLRIRLREVNMEFSALVRDKSGEGRFMRMGELKSERQALMAMLFGKAVGGRRPTITRQYMPGVTILHAAE
jgi:hypothetical protein